jgi:hypothetical protein
MKAKNGRNGTGMHQEQCPTDQKDCQLQSRSAPQLATKTGQAPLWSLQIASLPITASRAVSDTPERLIQWSRERAVPSK